VTAMIIRLFSRAVLMLALGVTALAQSQLSLADLEGEWLLDGEKSFSRSERSDISNYDLKISFSGQTLTLYWDYTIKKKRSHYSQTLVVDGKRQNAADYGGMAGGARGYSAKIKGNRIVQSMSYGTDQPKFGSYMDSRVLSLSVDKKVLTIENLFRSALPGDATNQGKQKLVFNRKQVS